MKEEENSNEKKTNKSKQNKYIKTTSGSFSKPP